MIRNGLNWAALLAVMVGMASQQSLVWAGESESAGPLFDEFDFTIGNGHRTEAAGPFYYSQETGTEKTWAIPPLFSSTTDPDLDLKELDFLYPLLTYDRYGKQSRWQFFQVLSFASTPSDEEQVRNRFTIFPLYFQQRSSDTNENYTAVVPFYGHLKKRLFRDEVSFVMLPFYVQSRKKDVVTDNYVWPFFHLRHGDGLKGWQFWPLLGEEHKVVTQVTNRFDEVEVIGGHDTQFALWPIFFYDRSGLGTANPVETQAMLPFYSDERSPQRDSTTVLWPFFTRIDDREKKYREWQLPWPFIVFSRGEGKHLDRVLPFFSVGSSSNLTVKSYLWPIFRHDHLHADPLDRKRNRILFFLYSDILERSTETQTSRRRTDLWPLFTRRRDRDGSTRLQLLAPLEVFTIGSHKIERDWSPVWSIWRAEANPKAKASSQSLLWNLYRHESAPNHRKTSLLFGLFQYQSGSEGNLTRLFYIPLSRSQPKAGVPASLDSATPGK